MKKFTLDLAIKEAKKYKTKKLFIHNCHSLYIKALKVGWMDILEKHLEDHQHKIKNLTFKECSDECKKFKTITDFCHNAPTHWRVAKRNDWITEISQHMINSQIVNDNKIKNLVKAVSGYREQGFWTLGRVKEELKKSEITDKRTLFLTRRDLYEVIYRHNWWNDIGIEFTKGDRSLKHTLESCKTIAKKYITISDFQSGDRNVYWAASNKGWLDQICDHMTVSKLHKKAGKADRKSNWTDNELISSAKLYSKVSDFQKKSRNQYYACYRRGPDFFKKATDHMRNNQFTRTPKYSDEQLKTEALKYKARYQFYKDNTKMYQAIIKRNLHHYLDHMQKNMKSNESELTHAHPEFYKLVNELGIDQVLYDKFFDGDRPDFVLIHQEKVIVVELKLDKTFWSVNDINEQLERYNETFFNYYKDQLVCYPILASPKGSYGVSYPEAIQKIKNLFKI